MSTKGNLGKGNAILEGDSWAARGLLYLSTIGVAVRYYLLLVVHLLLLVLVKLASR